MKKWVVCLGLLAALSLSSCNKASEDVEKASVTDAASEDGADRQLQEAKGADVVPEVKPDDAQNEASDIADKAEGETLGEAPVTGLGAADQKDSGSPDGLGVFHVDLQPTEGLARPKAEKHVSFRVLGKKKFKWLNPDNWMKENNFAKPQLPYTFEGYLVEGDPESEYGYMFSALFITSPNIKYVFDFYDHTLQNNVNDVYPFIKYATVHKGIIYAEIAHNAYTNDNPKTGFVVALNFEGKVLWISKDQVCNSNNFVIIENTIVCGYGFTKETDRIYMLDINTGEHIGDLSLSNKADFFLVRGDKMYVLGYNTEYTFEVVRK